MAQGSQDAVQTDTDSSIRNVVLITVDSLRADAIDWTSNSLRTPEIGRLAEEGIVFENAFAHGNWTPFSFPGILGSRSVFAESDSIGLPGSSTLAECLQNAGISTGGFNASNGFLTSHWGYDRGFDEFESFIGGDEMSRYQRYMAAHPTVNAWVQLAMSPFRRLVHRIRNGDSERPFADTSRMLATEDRAVEFVSGADEPFFLWVHYMDTHTPYAPAPRYLRDINSGGVQTHKLIRAHSRTGRGLQVSERTLEDLKTLYYGAVRQTDASIGRLREAVAEAGATDETAVVLAGDHGEEFMEHGNLSHYPKLYDDLVHVPLIVSLPGRKSQRVDDAVGLDGIPPTIAELFGVDTPTAWEGESLLPSVADGFPHGEDPVVSVTVRGSSVTQQPIPRQLNDGDLYVSARTADWTYIENTATGEQELYHRERDPDQQNDVHEAEGVPTDVPEGLAEAVSRHVRRLGGNGDGAGRIDTKISTRLEALGYR